MCGRSWGRPTREFPSSIVGEGATSHRWGQLERSLKPRCEDGGLWGPQMNMDQSPVSGNYDKTTDRGDFFFSFQLKKIRDV